MDEKNLNLIMNSLDTVKRCPVSDDFTRQVATAIRTEDERQTADATASWIPNLALAMVVLLLLLDGATLAWSWQKQQYKARSQAAQEMTRDSFWEDAPGIYRSPL